MIQIHRYTIHLLHSYARCPASYSVTSGLLLTPHIDLVSSLFIAFLYSRVIIGIHPLHSIILSFYTLYTNEITLCLFWLTSFNMIFYQFHSSSSELHSFILPFSCIVFHLNLYTYLHFPLICVGHLFESIIYFAKYCTV